jgi:hypothetical protein
MAKWKLQRRFKDKTPEEEAELEKEFSAFIQETGKKYKLTDEEIKQILEEEYRNDHPDEQFAGKYLLFDIFIDLFSKNQLVLLMEKVRKILEAGRKRESKLFKAKLSKRKNYEKYKKIYDDILSRYFKKNYKQLSKKQLHNLLSNLWREKALVDEDLSVSILPPKGGAAPKRVART